MYTDVTPPARDRSKGRMSGSITLAVVVGLGLLLAVVGSVTSGAGGFLIMAGLTLVILGVGGVVIGRRAWALITRRRVGAAALLSGLVLLVIGGLLLPPTPPTAPSMADAPTSSEPAPMPAGDPTDALIASASDGSALEVLGRLSVRDATGDTDFATAQFGQPWTDVDANGCDTASDTLIRDLIDPVIMANTGGCRVASGSLVDPYTSAALVYRAEDAGGPLAIDHVVSLRSAWSSGARGWDAARRLAFANDPLVVVTTSTAGVESKNSADAGRWLPAEAVRCGYVARQITVKDTYELGVSAAERAAMAGVLSSCRAEPTTSEGVVQGDRRQRQAQQVAADASARDRASASQAETDRVSAEQQAAAAATQRAADDAAAQRAATEAAAQQRTAEAAAAAQAEQAPQPDTGGGQAPAGNGSGSYEPPISVVTGGAFCSTVGAAGVSSAGNTLVCRPGADGKNRWQKAR